MVRPWMLMNTNALEPSGAGTPQCRSKSFKPRIVAHSEAGRRRTEGRRRQQRRLARISPGPRIPFTRKPSALSSLLKWDRKSCKIVRDGEPIAFPAAISNGPAARRRVAGLASRPAPGEITKLNFPRHGQVYRSDPGAEPERTAGRRTGHGLDASAAGYSVAGCSPAESVSAWPVVTHAPGSGGWRRPPPDEGTARQTTAPASCSMLGL